MGYSFSYFGSLGFIRAHSFIQESEDQTAAVKKGITAVVDLYKPHFNIVEETYDFAPNVSVYFRLDKFEAFDDGFINMVQSVQSILDNFNCQALITV